MNTFEKIIQINKKVLRGKEIVIVDGEIYICDKRKLHKIEKESLQTLDEFLKNTLTERRSIKTKKIWGFISINSRNKCQSR